jgi:hypothetical protein
MKKHWIFAVGATAVLIVGCSAGMQVESDWDQTADFSEYRTFSLMEETEARPTSQQLFAARVEMALENTLQEKGLMPVSSNPDLLVVWDAATEGKMSTSTYGTAYGGGYRGRYRRGGGFTMGTTHTTVNEWTEGTLVIEIIDVRREELVYFGSAQADLHEDVTPEQRTENAHNAVAKILEKFPAKQ